MKILFVSHSAVLKYHQQKLEILADKYNHEITLVTPPYWNEGGVEVKAYQENSKINYVTGKTVIIKKRMLHFYKNASRIVKKVNPDIIHIEEEPFNTPCYQFVKAAKRYKKKVLFFTWENIERTHNPIYSYFDRYSIKNSDYAIVGNMEGKIILEKKGFKKGIEIIPQYGINISDFSEIKTPRGKMFDVAFVGRLTYEKGVDVLLDAVKGMDNVRVNIAGTGDLDYENTLKEIIGRHDMSERVIFHGFIENKSMAHFLSKMNILVLPSRTTQDWKEQFGRVLIEGFASGCVVIGSSSGEIPHVISDGGLVFKEGDAEDLARKINSVISDGDTFKTYLQKGFERVSKNYTNDIIADKINSVYNLL